MKKILEKEYTLRVGDFDKYNRIKANQEKMLAENGKLSGFTGLDE